MIRTRLGELDRAGLEWVNKAVQQYKGPNRSEPISAALPELLKLTPEQLNTLLGTSSAASGGGLSLKSVSTPLLDSRLALLTAFKVDLQARLLSVRAQINFLNEEVESSRENQRLTFDSGITGENHARAVGNLNNNYRQYAIRARVIVDQISQLKL